MPGFNGTGPWGEGPMTGGARGFCNPAGAGFRRGFGRGAGRGRGLGAGFRGRRPGWNAFVPGGGVYQPWYDMPYESAPSDETQVLKRQADALRRDLDAVNRRLEELEKE